MLWITIYNKIMIDYYNQHTTNLSKTYVYL